DRLHPVLAAQGGVVVRGLEGAGQGLGRELAGPVDALPQAHDPHEALDVGQPVAVVVGDEQADRVGSAVDGGDTGHVGSLASGGVVAVEAVEAGETVSSCNAAATSTGP